MFLIYDWNNWSLNSVTHTYCFSSRTFLHLLFVTLFIWRCCYCCGVLTASSTVVIIVACWIWCCWWRCSLGRCCCSAWVALLLILKLFIKRADAIYTLLSFFFSFKFKAHWNLFKLVTFESKLIAALRLSVEFLDHVLIL